MSDTEVTCPYCKEEFDVSTDDGAHYNDGESEQEQCPNCEKYMLVTSSCSWYREAEAADCLNTGNHPWSEWKTYWRGEKEMHSNEFYERRYCTDCNKDEFAWHKIRLDLTPSERFDNPEPPKEQTL